jgi:hypothetical protein
MAAAWANAQALIAENHALMLAELDAWRNRHPREVQFVREEARAKVEGRKPNYPPARAYI